MNASPAAVEQYLTTRRALGFKLKPDGRMLLDFVDYLERSGASTVTTGAAVAWARQPTSAHPRWWNRRLGMVRGFARYLQAFDPATEVPPTDLLPCHDRRTMPYLYSSTDIAELLQAAGRLRSPLQATTYQTLIALLAVTGLRIGEACRLDRDDVDLDTGILTIIGTKFGKSRQVPLHDSTVVALATYARRRDQLCPRPLTPSFLVSVTNNRVPAAGACQVFARLLNTTQVRAPAGRRRPRLHDLRHSFAVASLLDWYRTDADVPVRLPLLSTYLGHVDPKSTYWYLQAAPELLALAAERLERSPGPLP
jgi:integrase/recombinase XerD